MADTPETGQQSPPLRISPMQRLLDNPFLLLFLGVASPTVLYIVWGILELVNIPVGN